MSKLEPIPIPPAQRWKRFRMEVVPKIVMVIACCTIGLLWHQNVVPRSVSGEVGATRAAVSSPKSGSVSDVFVHVNEDVQVGDVIARVVTTHPDVVEASLSLIRAKIGLIQMNLQPRLDRERNALRFEQLRLDWMSQRVELARSRVSLRRAENDVRRQQALLSGDVVSKDVAEVSVTARDSLIAEIAEREDLVKSIGESVQALRFVSDPDPVTEADEALSAAIAVQEGELRLAEAELRPIELLAPVSGQIRSLHRRKGETVLAGEAIATIWSREPGNIKTVVMAPVPSMPEAGDEVLIMTRAAKRSRVKSEVLFVGAHYESIESPLFNPGKRPMRGIPVHIRLPEELTVRPGEVVDLQFLN